MAESRRYGLGAQLDIEQILSEAQHRWLRPAEICEILRNYKNFRIASEPANRPPNGSLFLFDRKVLRYFRKDGHNWRKKRDGKTVKEAHERLKAGSIDVLHCYYAHGEENENFQRRSYWMLEEELSHIVLVHYREVKGNKTNYNRVKESEETTPDSRETEGHLPNSEFESSVSSKSYPYNYQGTSQTTDATSINSSHPTDNEDAESVYNNQASSGFHSFLQLQQPPSQKMDDELSAPYYPVPFSNDYQGKFPSMSEMDFISLAQGDRVKNSSDANLIYEAGKPLDFPSWDNDFEADLHSTHFQQSFPSMQRDTTNIMTGGGNELRGQVFNDSFGKKQDFASHPCSQEEWQNSVGDSAGMSKWSANHNLRPDSSYNQSSRFRGEVNPVDLFDIVEPTDPAEQNKHPTHNGLQVQPTNMEGGNSLKSELETNPMVEGKTNYPALRQPSLDGILRQGLKKLDSFDKWMSKELGDVDESHMQSNSASCWETVESEGGVDVSSMGPQVNDPYMLGPSLSQDQLFSIIDFSPGWAYSGSELKVLVTGRFLKSTQEARMCKWACMFGEMEVPADVIADGVLCCHTPLHKAGRVPFYVTCSNRLACSEVREFEFRDDDTVEVDATNGSSNSSNEILLHMRFGKLLSLGPDSQNLGTGSVGDDPELSSRISSLVKEDRNEWVHMLELTYNNNFCEERVRELLLEKLLKDKLHAWLLHKAAEGGKGPSVLDERGQGVVHFAAALGYDWAIEPTIAAGVSINFRDVNGWTALHWAASYGRERTVALLISLGADPGALTDPTPHYPSGRAPADLASSNGHKGIAGYLAESALSFHLSSLKLKETKEVGDDEISGTKAVQTVSERTATPVTDGEFPHGLSLKDSLAAVCNATQAAARIHQVFRVQSFQKKQLKGYSDAGFGMSDEVDLSLLAVKSSRARQHDVNAAAVRIQNKFRSWKGRREFLITRQRIVKIQALVRGHQVRKNYKKIIWSVGILEKVILRWRRKGSGLRGFKSEGPSMQDTTSKEDDYDFLKDGRKQTEARLEKALARVKSMVQYPEAREQYRRLLNRVSDMQETKAVSSRAMSSSGDVGDYDEDLIDLEALLDEDDTFMYTEP